MKKKSLLLLIVVLLTVISCNDTKKNKTVIINEKTVAELLPSWNDGETKKAIIAYVKKITDSTSTDFIPVNDRIATFDNDGTLWAEQPLYFQFFFMIDRIKALAPQHPEWKTTEPFKSVLEGDMKKALGSGEKGIGAMMAATLSGMTANEFDNQVKNWVNTAKHPQTQKKFTEMIYQPMLELMDYLRDNEFKTFIVSGGDIDFMRPWTEKVYKIPPQQVIGSSLKVKYEVRADTPIIMRMPEMNFIDDKAGKPVGIYQHIGKRPVLAAGNSDGDYEMLQWTTTGTGSRLGIIIHHTDSTREWSYDRNSRIGQLAKGIDDAPKYGWILVDMKNDWKKVFPEK